MVTHKPPNDDPRVALITRVIGDNRNAPNVWLARKIIQELDELDARASIHSREDCGDDWYSDWDGFDPDYRFAG